MTRSLSGRRACGVGLLAAALAVACGDDPVSPQPFEVAFTVEVVDFEVTAADATPPIGDCWISVTVLGSGGAFDDAAAVSGLELAWTRPDGTTERRPLDALEHLGTVRIVAGPPIRGSLAIWEETQAGTVSTWTLDLILPDGSPSTLVRSATCA